ncbi:MAG: penicillin acylase family protein [Anaerolineae bacterium]
MHLLRRVLTILFFVILILAVLLLGGATYVVRRSFPQIEGTVKVPGLKSQVEIHRDGWGIPHIYADNIEDLYFAQGYVHAQDRLWQMEFTRRVGHGTLSEVLGEVTLETDRFLRTIGLSRAAQAHLADLDEETLLRLQAYANGVNAFIDSHKGNLPLEFTILGFQPAHWQPLDSMVYAKLMAWLLGDNWEAELLRARLVKALGEEKAAALAPPYPAGGPFIIPPEAKEYAATGSWPWAVTEPTIPPEVDGYASLGEPSLSAYIHLEELLGLNGTLLGSNSWVVDGTKSVTGLPLLANDPHLSIQNPSIWYENHLVGGGLNVVGVSFPGSPGVIIGHNDHIAWGLTNLGPDVQDLYMEKINPDNPHQYQFKGKWEDMTLVKEVIEVKGRSQPEVLEVRLTRHGPIINDVVEGLEQPLAFRWTALESGTILRAIGLLNRAANWQDFREALRYFDVPAQNVVYADVEGNIGYQAPGLIPIRAKELGLVPAPGWTGEYEWTGYIPFEELPFVFNPPTHHIVTANNKIVPDSYPYFISYEWAAPYRAQRIVDLLISKDKLSIEDFQQIQADTLSIPAQKFMPHILRLQPEGILQERAMEQLRGWDLRNEADSAGAALFEVMYLKLVENTFADELGEELFEGYLEASTAHHMALERLMEEPDNPWFDDINTAEKETRDDILKKSFVEAIDFLGRRFGDVPHEWTWGRLHTSTFDHPLGSVKPLDKIFNSGPVPSRGSGFTVNASAFSYEEPFATAVLVSYRQIVDLDDWGKSVAMHTTGQSGQPFHRHFRDMLVAWQVVEYHPMYFDKEMVVPDREGLLILTPP